MSDVKYEKLAAIKPYFAPKNTPKKYTRNPCTLCGWSSSEAIHTNPQLETPHNHYHSFTTATAHEEKLRSWYIKFQERR